MDFYRFINSRDIREYHKEINYQYNAAEAAWLVFQCRDADMNEKHAAWQWIIDNMEDCQYARRLNYHCDSSIKSMLGKYIDFENRIIDRFFTNDGNCLYVSKSVYKRSDGTIEYGDWSSWDGIYSDFDKCWDALDVDEEDVKIIINKKHVNTEGGGIEVSFDPKDSKKIFGFELNRFELDEDDENLYAYCFEGMWFDFPTPFKKGDILINIDHNDVPFANDRINLEGLDERVSTNFREGGDNSDMGYGGYFINDQGAIYYDHGVWTYMDLEYYRKPLEGNLRSLIPVSNYLKERIGLELCLLGYQAIQAENFGQSSYPGWFTDFGLELAGIKEQKEARIWLDDIRTPSMDCYHCHSVNETKKLICDLENRGIKIKEINCDHDLGDYADDGGDGIKLIDWLAERETYYPIVIHTMNPVGRDNMQREIDRYWPEHR